MSEGSEPPAKKPVKIFERRMPWPREYFHPEPGGSRSPLGRVEDGAAAIGRHVHSMNREE